MQGFAVTDARSGIGQVLAIEGARSGVKHPIGDVDTEGLAVTEERLRAIGAPVKADRLDVTEREAFFHAVNAHSVWPARPTTTRASPSPVTSKAANSPRFGQVTATIFLFLGFPTWDRSR